MTKKKPLFTVMTLTFNRPQYLKQVVDCVQKQTYAPYVEHVIIDNGSTPETREYLSSLSYLESEKKIKIVRFEQNQYDPKRPGYFMDICCNKAMEVVEGEYILYLSDDDLIAEDYLECMARLFEENPNCQAVSGQPYSIDGAGKIREKIIYRNYRPRFMPGRFLVLDSLRGGKYLYSSPGSIFAFRTRTRRENGGFHESFDFTDFVSMVPFGEIGYDPKAQFFWRHHDNQLNKLWNDLGIVFIKDNENLIQEFNLKEKWDSFHGEKYGNEVCTLILNQAIESASNYFVINLYRFKFKASFNILCQGSGRWLFWRRLPGRFLKHKGYFISSIKHFIARTFFFIFPFAGKISPRLENIRKRVKENQVKN